MKRLACVVGAVVAGSVSLALAAHGERLAAFDGRCIPAGCVAPPSNTPGILGRRALPAGRLARLGATPDVHHGPLAQWDELSRQVEWLYYEGDQGGMKYSALTDISPENIR